MRGYTHLSLGIVAAAAVACGGLACASSRGPAGDTNGLAGSGSGSGSDDRGSASGSGSSSSRDSGGGSVPRRDAAAVWQPSTSDPIHFHWMIGSFSTADMVSDQEGQSVYDVDGSESTAADVAAIHAAGATAVCYVDVGSLEQGRPDYNDFPASVVGPPVQGWPGESWLLVTAANQSVILPLMKARFVSWCQGKDFDAIEPDNLDAWTNISEVSEADNIAYDLAIGTMAHDLSLSIGLKNVMTDLEPAEYATFVSTFDWVLNEQCFEYQECGVYTAAGSFLPAGKAVFDVEYNVSPDCAMAALAHMNAQLTDLDLVGSKDSGYLYTPCVPDSQKVW